MGAQTSHAGTTQYGARMSQVPTVLEPVLALVLEPRSLSTPLSPHPDTPAPTGVAALKAPIGSEVAESNDALLAACCHNEQSSDDGSAWAGEWIIGAEHRNTAREAMAP